MKPLDLAFVLAINLFWGLNFIAVKVGVVHYSPFLFSTLRFAALGLLLSPWIRPVAGQMVRIFLVGLTVGVLHFSLFFLGISLADDVSSAAIVTQLAVPYATLLAIAFLGERIGWRRASAICVAFLGVVVLGFDPRVLGYLDAILVLSIGSLFFATGQVLMRGLRGVGVMNLQGWIAIISVPPMLALSLIFEDGQAAKLMSADLAALGSVAYAVVLGSIVGHGGVYYLIRLYPVSTVAPLLLPAPVVGVAAGVLLLDNVVTLQIAVGGLMTFLGVVVITLRSAGRAPVPPEAVP